MKRLLTVVGARPQFIKASVTSRLIKEVYQGCLAECIVHTGQHYDSNMSGIFFTEMRIPEPNINLGIGSASHGKQTGEMLLRIEEVILAQKPDCVLVYGDTNSTLAGALGASKLGIPVAHIEAGLRSYNRKMAEEQNRVVTDHLSSFLYCPTVVAESNLAREGILEGVRVTGDIMYDASLFYRGMATDGWKATAAVDKALNRSDGFYLLTMHRAENTDDPGRLAAIVGALNRFDGRKGVFPIHPRTRKAMQSNGLFLNSRIEIIEPVGYLDMLTLEAGCEFIVTDSGGVQKEAYFFQKPCITLRDETEWVETVDNGWNTLTGADEQKILAAMAHITKPSRCPELFGNGHAGAAILEHLKAVL